MSQWICSRDTPLPSPSHSNVLRAEGRRAQKWLYYHFSPYGAYTWVSAACSRVMLSRGIRVMVRICPSLPATSAPSASFSSSHHISPWSLLIDSELLLLFPEGHSCYHHHWLFIFLILLSSYLLSHMLLKKLKNVRPHPLHTVSIIAPVEKHRELPRVTCWTSRAAWARPETRLVDDSFIYTLDFSSTESESPFSGALYNHRVKESPCPEQCPH